MNDNQQIFCAPIRQVQPVTSATNIFTVGDAGHVCRRSPSSMRRLAAELKIEPQRTANGTRIFSAQQVQRLAEEVTRREREASKNWRACNG